MSIESSTGPLGNYKTFKDSRRMVDGGRGLSVLRFLPRGRLDLRDGVGRVWYWDETLALESGAKGGRKTILHADDGRDAVRGNQQQNRTSRREQE